MKKYLFLALCILLVYNSYGQEPITPKTKLIVYYFHITNRCNTCKKIEAVTQKTLNETYAKQLENGTIIYKTFNVDLPENSELVKKYQAYGATLALTYIVDGKEAGIEDLTGMAFQKIGNEEAYINELKSKIDPAIQ